MSIRKSVLAVVCGVVVVGFFLNKGVKPRAVFVSQAVPQNSFKKEDVQKVQSGETEVARGVAQVSDQVDQEFVHWFTSEASLIDERKEDTLATEEELKVKAQQFRHQEVSYLAKIVASRQAPASERILASYLLSLSAETAGDALVDIATQEAATPGSHPAHSIEEAKSVQERSYKIMAVDAIYNSSSQITEKLKQLDKIINQTPDITVKRYASDKADDLKSTF